MQRISPTLGAAPPPCMVHQNMADHLCAKRQEVCPALASDSPCVRELKVDLVSQRSGFQTLATAPPQILPRDSTEFRIKKRGQAVQRVFVAIRPCREHRGDVVLLQVRHTRRILAQKNSRFDSFQKNYGRRRGCGLDAFGCFADHCSQPGFGAKRPKRPDPHRERLRHILGHSRVVPLSDRESTLPEHPAGTKIYYDQITGGPRRLASLVSWTATSSFMSARAHGRWAVAPFLTITCRGCARYLMASGRSPALARVSWLRTRPAATVSV